VKRVACPRYSSESCTAARARLGHQCARTSACACPRPCLPASYPACPASLPAHQPRRSSLLKARLPRSPPPPDPPTSAACPLSHTHTAAWVPLHLLSADKVRLECLYFSAAIRRHPPACHPTRLSSTLAAAPRHPRHLPHIRHSPRGRRVRTRHRPGYRPGATIQEAVQRGARRRQRQRHRRRRWLWWRWQGRRHRADVRDVPPDNGTDRAPRDGRAQPAGHAKGRHTPRWCCAALLLRCAVAALR
jgi:hypothetical protein